MTTDTLLAGRSPSWPSSRCCRPSSPATTSRCSNSRRRTTPSQSWGRARRSKGRRRGPVCIEKERLDCSLSFLSSHIYPRDYASHRPTDPELTHKRGLFVAQSLTTTQLDLTSFSMPNFGRTQAFEEHCPQNTCPHALQWCCRVTRPNSARHLWHTEPSTQSGATSDSNMA